jgi:hypothetical protein
MPIRAKVEFHKGDIARVLRNLNELQRWEPMARVIDDGARVLDEHAKRRFPSGTSTQLGTPRPLVGEVRLVQPRHAILLNYGGRGRQSRWRAFKPGKRTRGWFSGTVRLKAVKARMDQLIERARHELEAVWRR